jgi:hypothetical protein
MRLVPSEHSSGASRVQGPITKTGNTHARRLLVEAAWHHRARYQPSKTIRDRWELAPPAARLRGDQGNRRLHARWVRFIDRKKKPRGARPEHPDGRLTLALDKQALNIRSTVRGPSVVDG